VDVVKVTKKVRQSSQITKITENFYNGCQKMNGSREEIRRLRRQRHQEEPIGEAPEGTKCILNGGTVRTRCILKLVGSTTKKSYVIEGRIVNI